MPLPHWLAAILASLTLASLTFAQDPGAGLSDEQQLILNLHDEIVDYCVYRPKTRDIVSGALRALSRELGQKYAPYFPREIPATPPEALATFMQAVRTVAQSEEGLRAGFTVKGVIERSIRGYCRSLDPYSDYTDEATARGFARVRDPDYMGIGITFRRLNERFLCTPFAGSAADLAGVVDGDELLEVDGRPVRGMTLLELAGRVGGEAGTVVKLKLKHRDGLVEEVTATREPISSTPITLTETERGVRVSLRRINDRAFEDLRTLLTSIGPSRRLTLDLRSCGGGEFKAAVRIAELFLPEHKVIAKLETARGSEKLLSGNRAPYRPAKLILLQDEATASGAELIITALLSHAPLKAESRGFKTFGKGVVTQEIAVVRGGVLQITEARMYGPNDEYWDGEGLPPSSDSSVEAP